MVTNYRPAAWTLLMQIGNRRWLLTLLAFIAAPLTAGVEPPPSFQPFTAKYRGEAMGFSVNDLGTRQLKALGDQRFELKTKADAMVYSAREVSSFSWDQGEIVPHSYESERGSIFSKRKNSLEFNWQDNKIRFRHKKDRGEIELKSGTQDPLTGLLTLAHQLMEGDESLRYLEAKDDETQVRRYELVDTPKIKTDMGMVATYHLRQLDEGPDRQTEIWLHRAHPYIPIKVKQIDDGDRFLLEITAFELK